MQLTEHMLCLCGTNIPALAQWAHMALMVGYLVSVKMYFYDPSCFVLNVCWLNNGTFPTTGLERRSGRQTIKMSIFDRCLASL